MIVIMSQSTLGFLIPQPVPLEYQVELVRWQAQTVGFQHHIYVSFVYQMVFGFLNQSWGYSWDFFWIV